MLGQPILFNDGTVSGGWNRKRLVDLVCTGWKSSLTELIREPLEAELEEALTTMRGFNGDETFDLDGLDYTNAWQCLWLAAYAVPNSVLPCPSFSLRSSEADRIMSQYPWGAAQLEEVPRGEFTSMSEWTALQRYGVLLLLGVQLRDSDGRVHPRDFVRGEYFRKEYCLIPGTTLVYRYELNCAQRYTQDDDAWLRLVYAGLLQACP